jgi:hypothetical protein
MTPCANRFPQCIFVTYRPCARALVLSTTGHAFRGYASAPWTSASGYTNVGGCCWWRIHTSTRPHALNARSVDMQWIAAQIMDLSLAAAMTSKFMTTAIPVNRAPTSPLIPTPWQRHIHRRPPLHARGLRVVGCEQTMPSKKEKDRRMRQYAALNILEPRRACMTLLAKYTSFETLPLCEER